MKVLGVHWDGRELRGAVVERVDRAVAVVSTHTWSMVRPDALREGLVALVSEAQVASIALLLSPEESLVGILPGSQGLKTMAERRRSARYRAEANAYSVVDPVRVVQGKSGASYFAVASRDRLRAFVDAAAIAKARLVRVEHEGYAWASTVEGAQALVVVEPQGVRLVILGDERIETATFARDSLALRDELKSSLLDALTAGFADIDTVAVHDPDGIIDWTWMHQHLPQMRFAPYRIAHQEGREAYGAAIGAALDAVRPSKRLSVNFLDRVNVLADLGDRLLSQLERSDLALLGAVVVLALGVFLWQSQTLRALHGERALLSSRIGSAKETSTAIATLEVNVATARSILDNVETTRRTGPLLAREIAAVVGGLDDATSASALSMSAGRWTLTGHSTSEDHLAFTVRNLDALRFAPSLAQALKDGNRFSYTLSLQSRLMGR